MRVDIFIGAIFVLCSVLIIPNIFQCPDTFFNHLIHCSLATGIDAVTFPTWYIVTKDPKDFIMWKEKQSVTTIFCCGDHIFDKLFNSSWLFL